MNWHPASFITCLKRIRLLRFIIMSATMNNYKIGLIDVGSLKVKCEVRDYTGLDDFKIPYRTQERTALARALEDNGNVIGREAIDATIAALKKCQDDMTLLHVTDIRIVGTEAIRKADNASDVLEKIEVQTGLKIEIIDQLKEGAYFFKAVADDFPQSTIASVDIGGGSMQVVIGKGKNIFEQHLFPTGTYVTRKTFIKDDLPTSDNLRDAREFVFEKLNTLAKSSLRPQYIIYGSTNVIDFVEALDIKRGTLQEAHGEHSLVIDKSILSDVLNRIGPLPYAERELLYPAEPFYMHGADMALLNILAVCHFLEAEKVVPSNQNVSSGIFREMATERFN